MSGRLIFSMLGGSVVMEDGRVRLLGRGDPIPDGMAKGELGRLRSLGAVGEEQEEGEPPAFDAKAATEAELLEWFKGSKPVISDVLELAGDDAEFAVRLLAAERAATGDEPRKGVLEGLTAIIDAATDPGESKAATEGGGD